KPVEQPVIMFAVIARAVPCSAREIRSSAARVNVIVSPSIANWIAAGTSKSRLPWGPLTDNVCPLTVTVTPLGIFTGDLPIRLMVLFLRGGGAGHQTLQMSSPPMP